MTLPTLHPNGTSPDRLAEAYERAYDAVQAAYEAVRETAPNARDYYVQDSDAMRRACDEHQHRLHHLHTVLAELDELVGHCERKVVAS